MQTWEELKRRKIVQWSLAYLAGAWVVLEVTSLVGGHFGWPNWVHQVLIVLAAIGFFFALVVAWYHGEQGRQRVSGPELLMVAALLVVAAVGIRLVVQGPDAGTAGGTRTDEVPERSVAVLPLDNMSADEDQAFFADAMTEEITSALTEVPELVVTSRNSASQFTGSGKTVREFARALGVAHVIEGSVQRSGDRVRITVQLIDARTDQHIWSDTYERRLSDLFDVQAEVAEEVANRLAAAFTDRERDRILSAATDDPVAYDLFLQATTGPTGAGAAPEAMLRQAVERDPDFWPAWEALGHVYLDLESREGGAWADSSRLAFERAIRTTDNPSVRLRIEAFQALVFGGDETALIARLRAAVEERPSDLALVSALGELTKIRGRLPEAARWMHQAARLDPLQAARWSVLFQPYWWAGLYDAAEAVIRRARELDPQRVQTWESMVWLWLAQEQWDQALAAADSAEALGSVFAPIQRGMVHWWAGDVQRADSLFAAVDVFGRFEELPYWLLLMMADAEYAAGDSARASRIVEAVREGIDARVIEDYEPEWRVFPRLQLAAIEGRTQDAIALFRRYIERGGRDYRWFQRSPLFEELRAEPEFRDELEGLARRVGSMRRQMASDWRVLR